MMSYAVSDLSYLLALCFNLAAYLLILEWFIHALPGAGLNFARRALFKASFPLLKLSDRFFDLKWGFFNSRGLLLAVLLLLVSRYGVPWLVFFGFSMRG
jgi:hypothetical protein